MFLSLISIYAGADLERAGLASVSSEERANAIVALRKIHERGVLWNDVALRNILVREDGSLVFVDFGLARVLDLSAHQSVIDSFKQHCRKEESELRDLLEC